MIFTLSTISDKLKAIPEKIRLARRSEQEILQAIEDNFKFSKGDHGLEAKVKALLAFTKQLTEAQRTPAVVEALLIKDLTTRVPLKLGITDIPNLKHIALQNPQALHYLLPGDPLSEEEILEIIYATPVDALAMYNMRLATPTIVDAILIKNPNLIGAFCYEKCTDNGLLLSIQHMIGNTDAILDITAIDFNDNQQMQAYYICIQRGIEGLSSSKNIKAMVNRFIKPMAQQLAETQLDPNTAPETVDRLHTFLESLQAQQLDIPALDAFNLALIKHKKALSPVREPKHSRNLGDMCL